MRSLPGVSTRTEAFMVKQSALMVSVSGSDFLFTLRTNLKLTKPSRQGVKDNDNGSLHQRIHIIWHIHYSSWLFYSMLLDLYRSSNKATYKVSQNLNTCYFKSVIPDTQHIIHNNSIWDWISKYISINNLSLGATVPVRGSTLRLDCWSSQRRDDCTTEKWKGCSSPFTRSTVRSTLRPVQAQTCTPNTHTVKIKSQSALICH